MLSGVTAGWFHLRIYELCTSFCDPVYFVSFLDQISHSDLLGVLQKRKQKVSSQARYRRRHSAWIRDTRLRLRHAAQNAKFQRQEFCHRDVGEEGE